MRHGFTREGKGLRPVAEQRAALIAAGVPAGRIHHEPATKRSRGRPQKGADGPSEWTLTMRAVRKGDRLDVADAAALAPDRATAMARLAEIEAVGAVVFDLAAGEEARGLAGGIAFVDRADVVFRRNRTASARRVLAGAANRRAKPAKLAVMPRDKRAELAADWHNPNMTADQVEDKWKATKWKVSKRTLAQKPPRGLGPRFPEGLHE